LSYKVLKKPSPIGFEVEVQKLNSNSINSTSNINKSKEKRESKRKQKKRSSPPKSKNQKIKNLALNSKKWSNPEIVKPTFTESTHKRANEKIDKIFLNLQDFT